MSHGATRAADLPSHAVILIRKGAADAAETGDVSEHAMREVTVMSLSRRGWRGVEGGGGRLCSDPHAADGHRC